MRLRPCSGSCAPPRGTDALRRAHARRGRGGRPGLRRARGHLGASTGRGQGHVEAVRALVAALAEVQADEDAAREDADALAARCAALASGSASAPRETPFAFSETRRASRSRTRRVLRGSLYEHGCACGIGRGDESRSGMSAARSTRRRRGLRRTRTGYAARLCATKPVAPRGRAGRGWACQRLYAACAEGRAAACSALLDAGASIDLTLAPHGGGSVAAARSRRVRPGGGGARALCAKTHGALRPPRPARRAGSATSAGGGGRGWRGGGGPRRCRRRAPPRRGSGTSPPLSGPRARRTRGRHLFGFDAAFESAPILAAAETATTASCSSWRGRGADARAAEALGAPTFDGARGAGPRGALGVATRAGSRRSEFHPCDPAIAATAGGTARRRVFRSPRGGTAPAARGAGAVDRGVSFGAAGAARRRRDAVARTPRGPSAHARIDGADVRVVGEDAEGAACRFECDAPVRARGVGASRRARRRRRRGRGFLTHAALGGGAWTLAARPSTRRVAVPTVRSRAPGPDGATSG